MLQNNQKNIRHKVGPLNLAEELGNVSKACQVIVLSRGTFYHYRNAMEEGDVEALLEKPRRVPNLKKEPLLFSAFSRFQSLISAF